MMSTSWATNGGWTVGPAPAGGRITLVGVAHVVDLKADLARVMASTTPDAVAIELDATRAEALSARSEAKDRGEPDPAAQRRAGQPILLRMWAHMQDRLATQLGDIPGAEMLEALHLAKARNVPCYLIDDPIQTVAPRLMQSLSGKERVQLLIASVIALVIPARVVEKQLQNYTEERGAYLEALRTQYPSVTRILIDERNLHMGQRLGDLAGRHARIMAVVGDAHVTGLQEVLTKAGHPVDLVHLETLHPATAGPQPAATGGPPVTASSATERGSPPRS